MPHILIAAGLVKNFYTSQLAIQISRFNIAKNVAPYPFTLVLKFTFGS